MGDVLKLDLLPPLTLEESAELAQLRGNPGNGNTCRFVELLRKQKKSEASANMLARASA